MIRIIPLTDPKSGTAGRRRAWLASDVTGVPIGSAFLRILSGAGQEHQAALDLQVHPAERRRGTGSQLLATVLTAAREENRRQLVAAADADSAGQEFLRAKGFRKAMTLIYTRLSLADLDLDALTATVEKPHPGYRLVSWDGVVPDHLAATFAASHRAMEDMPVGDLAVDEPVDGGTPEGAFAASPDGRSAAGELSGTGSGKIVWDEARVREVEGAIAERGDLLLTVAAVDEADGSIVGFTELVIPGERKGDGEHYGTGVLPEHRGRGLGRWMKAEAIRQVRERYPDLGGLLADTVESNFHMRNINHALGYRRIRISVEYRLDL
jgi:ribosomal protein S18 acetylase RimI-like enzyme